MSAIIDQQSITMDFNGKSYKFPFIALANIEKVVYGMYIDGNDTKGRANYLWGALRSNPTGVEKLRGLLEPDIENYVAYQLPK